VRSTRVWARLLGLRRAVIEDVWIGDEGEVVVARAAELAGARSLRDLPAAVARVRSGRRATALAGAGPRHDAGVRRGRLAAGHLPPPRRGGLRRAVGAPRLAVHAAFEDQTAWLAVNCSKTAVAQLMRIAWRTVGGILERVCAETIREVDLLADLRRIGIDEISHRRGQRYLTVVVCHDTGRLVWAAAGRDRKTVEAFLDALGEERCKQIELVSCDMASWIAAPIAPPFADLCPPLPR
jgi:transposase